MRLWIKAWLAHVAFAADLLHQYGERATPGALRFVWDQIATTRELHGQLAVVRQARREGKSDDEIKAAVAAFVAVSR